MPFIEITDADPGPQIREKATQTMTEGLCQAYSIKPDIVTCYYFSASDYSYGHAGKYGVNAENFRIFIKLHAFPRDADAKRVAAKLITEAVCAAYGAASSDVVIYFMDIPPQDAFHGGQTSA